VHLNYLTSWVWGSGLGPESEFIPDPILPVMSLNQALNSKGGVIYSPHLGCLQFVAFINNNTMRYLSVKLFFMTGIISLRLTLRSSVTGSKVMAT
jgi:hypothetical protein